MKNLKPSTLGIAASVIHSNLGQAQQELEEVINEIVAIMDVSPDEVKAFCQEHSCSLDYIKQAALFGAKLDIDDMQQKMLANAIGQATQTLANFTEWSYANMTFKEKVVDKLEDIVFYIGYWVTYSILWFADLLWSGISKAYEDTWGIR